MYLVTVLKMKYLELSPVLAEHHVISCKKKFKNSFMYMLFAVLQIRVVFHFNGLLTKK